MICAISVTIDENRMDSDTHEAEGGTGFKTPR